MITFGVKNLHGEIRRNVEESKFQMLRAHQRARALASLAGGKLAAPWLERSRILHISPSENARDTEDMHHRVGGVRTPSVWKLVLLREPSRPKAERPFETFASTSTRVLRRGSSFPALSLSLSFSVRGISFGHRSGWDGRDNDKILRSFNEVTANESARLCVKLLSPAC